MKFKPLEIKEYKNDNNLLVYSDGRIFNNLTKEFIKPTKTRFGFYNFRFNKKTYTLHKVIAETFIPNPNNFKFVNHKDTCLEHNFTENLEWCTRKYLNNYNKWLTDKITKEELDSYNTKEYNK